MKTFAILLAGTAMLAGASAYAQTASDRASSTARDAGQTISDTAKSTANTAKDAANSVSGSTKPAIKSSNDVTSGAPIAGANSFTEGQAKSRIEARGYANVTGLNKDGQGVWHASATKNGKQTQVALDYQGNVVEGAATGTGSSTPTSGSMTPSTTAPNTSTPTTTNPAAPPSNSSTTRDGSTR